MSNTKQTAVKAGIGYTVGNILIKGISFMTLPVFSRLLTTEQFGVYNVFVSYEAILYVVVGMALHASVRSANLEFKGKIDEYTSSVSLIYIFNAVLFLLAALVFGGPLSRLLSFKRGIMVLLVLDSFGSAVLTLYNNRISLDYAYKKYMAAALCNSGQCGPVADLDVHSIPRQAGHCAHSGHDAHAVCDLAGDLGGLLPQGQACL